MTTVAGTGEQARSYGASGPGPLVPLSSPWDLAVVGGSLYVAMASTHQLYHLDLSTGQIQPHAGSGREALADGSLGSADLARPMMSRPSRGRASTAR